MGRPLRVSPEWTGRIRSALQRDPLSEAIQLQQLDTPTNRFAGGVAFVLSGHAHSARTAFNQVVNDKLTSDVISLAARIGIGIAGLLLGDFDSDAMELLAREADLTGQSHLARLASVVATTSYDKDPFYALPDWPHAVSDRWVYAVALCVLGLRPPSDQSAAPGTHRSTFRCRRHDFANLIEQRQVVAEAHAVFTLSRYLACAAT